MGQADDQNSSFRHFLCFLVWHEADNTVKIDKLAYSTFNSEKQWTSTLRLLSPFITTIVGF
jgi:hypothetical protein